LTFWFRFRGAGGYFIKRFCYDRHYYSKITKKWARGWSVQVLVTVSCWRGYNPLWKQLRAKKSSFKPLFCPFWHYEVAPRQLKYSCICLKWKILALVVLVVSWNPGIWLPRLSTQNSGTHCDANSNGWNDSNHCDEYNSTCLARSCHWKKHKFRHWLSLPCHLTSCF